jgi:hypothetical protein
MINWKGFGRKRSLPDKILVRGLACGTERNHEVSRDSRWRIASKSAEHNHCAGLHVTVRMSEIIRARKPVYCALIAIFLLASAHMHDYFEGEAICLSANV